MRFPKFPCRVAPFCLALAVVSGTAVPLGLAAQDGEGQSAAQSGADLGVDLYRSLASTGGNVLFSPYSVSEALALLSAGAGGRTKEELLAALHWGRPPDGLAGAFGAQDRHLDLAAQGGPTLLVANGLWYQQGEPQRPAFLKTAVGDFGAEVRSADFIGNTPAVRREINSWVELKTFGKFPDMLPEGALNAATRLALANAVYFKGRWIHPFEANETRPGNFYVAPDRTVMTPLMSEKGEFKDASAPSCELLELPYAGGAFSMVVLLPHERDGLPDLERDLNAKSLFEWLSTLDFSKRRHMHVTLPRFKMTYSIELGAALKGLGVKAAFDPHGADFSAINGGRDLFVSTVLHKALVDVNEEGTEASAVTFAKVATLGMELSDEFNADHPFLFLIRDNSTDSLLFLGRVIDPKAL